MSDTSTEVERMSDDDLLLQINRFDPYDVEFARRFRALAAERDALRAALESVAFEYDSSECSANGQTMYDIAYEALNTKARRSHNRATG